MQHQNLQDLKGILTSIKKLYEHIGNDLFDVGYAHRIIHENLWNTHSTTLKRLLVEDPNLNPKVKTITSEMIPNMFGSDPEGDHGIDNEFDQVWSIPSGSPDPDDRTVDFSPDEFTIKTNTLEQTVEDIPFRGSRVSTEKSVVTQQTNLNKFHLYEQSQVIPNDIILQSPRLDMIASAINENHPDLYPIDKALLAYHDTSIPNGLTKEEFKSLYQRFSQETKQPQKTNPVKPEVSQETKIKLRAFYNELVRYYPESSLEELLEVSQARGATVEDLSVIAKYHLVKNPLPSPENSNPGNRKTICKIESSPIESIIIPDDLNILTPEKVTLVNSEIPGEKASTITYVGQEDSNLPGIADLESNSEGVESIPTLEEDIKAVKQRYKKEYDLLRLQRAQAISSLKAFHLASDSSQKKPHFQGNVNYNPGETIEISQESIKDLTDELEQRAKVYED